MKRHPFPILVAGLALIVAATAPGARASTNGLTAPFYRGFANTEAALWETFSSPSGTNNSPNAGANVFTQTGNGGILQSDTNAFLTGSGNIYNLSTNSVSQFTLSDSVAYTLGNVTFQVRGLGSELDYANVALRYDIGGGPQLLLTNRVELLRDTNGLGTYVNLWSWDVSSLNISSFEVLFNASASSLSLDSVVLDTAASSVVPEPSTWALLALGTLGVFAVRRRARRV